jgi:hypothetical protein
MKNSYAIVDAAEIRAACETYLKFRQDKIDRQTEEMIQAEMNRTFFKAKDRDVARKRCAESINMLHFRGGYWARRVEDLLKLTTLAVDGNIRLNSDDASLLGDYL